MHDKFSCETTCINGRKSAKKKEVYQRAKFHMQSNLFLVILFPSLRIHKKKEKSLSCYKLLFHQFSYFELLMPYYIHSWFK